MQLVRTTLRLQADLKQIAEERALHEQRTLQEIFNEALKEYLAKGAAKKAKRIVFKSHDLGVPLDRVTRSDYYSVPRVK